MKINIFNSNLINTYKITEVEIYKPNVFQTQKKI